MFRNDFATGQFPISKRCPVIGFHHHGKRSTPGFPVSVVYNHKNLREMAIDGLYGKITMVGIWPGKRNTDLFYLNPDYYKDISIPPEGHEDIDSADAIIISYSAPNVFDHVTYQFSEQTPIICKDPSIVNYIKESGIRHTVVLECDLS